jgi:hypothetical protein
MSERVNPRPEALADLPPIWHCRVTDRHGRLPALLLEWRRHEDGWHGRMVRPVLEDGAWQVVEEWLPAGPLDRA